MWEVVKTVKGYDITRMVGSRGAYHVSVLSLIHISEPTRRS
mgnify:CR=1 FL=1